MGKNKYPTNIAQLDKEIQELFKREYLVKVLDRFCLLMSQIGDIFHYLTHDPEFNPPARAWDSKEDHKSILAQALMQLLMTCSAAGINFIDLFREALGLPKNHRTILSIHWLEEKIATWKSAPDLIELRNHCLELVISTNGFLQNYQRNGFSSNKQPDDRVLMCSSNSLRSLIRVVLAYGYSFSEILKLGLDNQRSLDWAKKDSHQGEEHEIIGLVAMPGRIDGTAYVVSKDNPLDSFPAGGVLVITHAKPDYVEAITKAAAVVTDNGGIACHAATIAREFSIPCLVGTGNATGRIRHGSRVLVDALSLIKDNKGKVFLF